METSRKNNFLFEATSDTKLFKVYVSDVEKQVYIGVVREEDNGWLPLGAFVFKYSRTNSGGEVNTYFDTKDKAAEELVYAWVYQLGRALAKR